jgi:hypothetical protein
MKALARAMLWLGFAFLVFDFGSLAATHRVGGNAIEARFRIERECRARQATLESIDRSGWTDIQRNAFDNICAVAPFKTGMFDVDVSGGFMASLLFAGSLLYLVAIFREGFKGKREAGS